LLLEDLKKRGGTGSKLKGKGSGKEQMTKVFVVIDISKGRTVLEG